MMPVSYCFCPHNCHTQLCKCDSHLTLICPIRKTLWKVKWIWSYRAIQHRLPRPVHFSRGLCCKWKSRCRQLHCWCPRGRQRWCQLNLPPPAEGGPQCSRGPPGHPCCVSALVFQRHRVWQGAAFTPEGQQEAGGTGGLRGMAGGLCREGQGTYPRRLCFHGGCEWHARCLGGYQQLRRTGKSPHCMSSI